MKHKNAKTTKEGKSAVNTAHHKSDEISESELDNKIDNSKINENKTVNSNDKKESKSSSKKSYEFFKRKKSWIILGIIFIIFLIVLIVIWVKAEFILKDELNLRIDPKEMILNLGNNEDVNLNFTILNDNFARCKSVCNLQLTNIGEVNREINNKAIVSNETIYLDHLQETTKYFTIKTPIKGAGQIVYNFDAKCSNINSFLCPSEGEQRFKTVLITINYDISNEEKITKELAKQTINMLINETAKADVNFEENQNFAGRLPINSVDKSYFLNQNQNILSQIKEVKNTRDQLITYWSLQDYKSIAYDLTNQNLQKYNQEVFKIAQDGNLLKANIKNTIAMHNLNLITIKNLAQNKNEINLITAYYLNELNRKNANILDELHNNSKLINNDYYALKGDFSLFEKNVNLDLMQFENYTKKAFADYDTIKTKGVVEQIIANNILKIRLENIQASLLNNSTNNENNSGYNNSLETNFVNNTSKENKDYNAAKELNDILLADLQNEFTCSNLKKSIVDMELTNKLALEVTSNQYNWSFGNLEFNQIFSKANDLTQWNALLNSKEMLINNLAGTSLMPNEKSLALELLDNKINNMKNSIIAKWGSIDNLVILESYTFTIGINNTVVITKKEFMTLSLLSNSNGQVYTEENCKDEILFGVNKITEYTPKALEIGQMLNLDFSSYVFEPINETPNELEADYTLSISDNLPQCCTYGKCTNCCDENSCKNEEQVYPILFIHGHAFNVDNTPEYSMMSFAKIQTALKEDGYLNSGELELSEQPDSSIEGTWGRSKRPVTARASYYYITHYSLGKYQVSTLKSERIENYAIRLREIIQALKYRTGSNKVIIVAHSMGGLVTRQYIDLFGAEDIDKLIMINAPNHGINDKVYQGCVLLGSKIECDDMKYDSIFISRINANNFPTNLQVYNIRSIGCDMNGESGDGIVTNSSAYLEGTNNYLYEGKCTDNLQTSLHTDALDPNKNPKVFMLLREILISKEKIFIDKESK